MPYPGQTDPTAPARWAAIAMFVFGLLAMVMAGCVGVGLAILPGAELEKMRQQANSGTEIYTPEALLHVIILVMTVIGSVGLLFVILSWLVRRGAKIPCRIALVLTGMVEMMLVLNALAALAHGQPQGLPLAFVVIAVLGLIMHWLIQALRNGPQIAEWRARAAAAPYSFPQVITPTVYAPPTHPPGYPTKPNSPQ